MNLNSRPNVNKLNFPHTGNVYLTTPNQIKQIICIQIARQIDNPIEET